ncbi:MAG: hypothetical protein H8F28_11745, partial [Fibrella sp.]|nr:hypothetical protein [Armatimonadota bacterium]
MKSLTEKVGLNLGDNPSGVGTEGFEDLPESSDIAMRVIIDTLPAAGRNQDAPFTTEFRAGARKIIFMVTDNLPTGVQDNYFQPESDFALAHDVAVAARAKGVRIIPIYTPPRPSSLVQSRSLRAHRDMVLQVMRDYADTTRGYFREVQTNGSGISQVMVEAIALCADYRRGSSEAITRVTDTRGSPALITLTKSATSVVATEQASFDMRTATRGKVKGLVANRRGTITRLGAGTFEMEWGVYRPNPTNPNNPALGEYDFATVLPINAALPKPLPYVATWALSTANIIADLQTKIVALNPADPATWSYNLRFADRISGLCLDGPPVNVKDTPQGSANSPADLTLRVRPRYTGDVAADSGSYDNPRIRVGTSLDITIPDPFVAGDPLPAPTPWQVVFDGTVVASAQQPNGWTVAPNLVDLPGFQGVTVAVPGNALVANGYEVRYNLPAANGNPGRVGAGVFDVVDAQGNQARFNIVANPGALTVNVGTQGTTTVTVTGTTQPVALWLADVPPGVTYSYSPATVSDGQYTSQLTIKVGYATEASPAGGYVLKVVGIWRDVIASGDLNLEVPSGAAKNFTMKFSPGLIEVRPGEEVEATLTVSPSATLSDIVAITTTKNPYNAESRVGDISVAVQPGAVSVAGADGSVSVKVRIAASPLAKPDTAVMVRFTGKTQYTPLTVDATDADNTQWADPWMEVKVVGLRINSGGPAFTLPSGSPITSQVWLADTFMAGGFPYTLPTAPPDEFEQYPDLPLYYDGRYSSMPGTGTPAAVPGESFSYVLPAPALRALPHFLSLHFLETEYAARGQRLFHVDINGQRALSNFDIFAYADGTSYYGGAVSSPVVVSLPVPLIPTEPDPETIWIDDALPAGATASTAASGPPVVEGWEWGTANPNPFSGTKHHRSPLSSGTHWHYFNNASATLPVAKGELLFAYVYIDPANLPSEIMLQWTDTSGGAGATEHRAYWGSDNIAWGIQGTASRRYMGSLPKSGRWVRLQVPADAVGLEGKTVQGMGFALHGGQANWDKAGKGLDASTVVVRFEAVTGRAMVQALALSTGTEGESASAVKGLSAPTNLVARAGNVKVTLTWSTVLGADQYFVRRKENGIPLAGLTRVYPNGTGTTLTWVDTQVVNGRMYQYTVAAVKNANYIPLQSAPSAEVSATPRPDGPGAPANLTATAGDASVTLLWGAASPAPAGTLYRVQRSEVTNGAFQRVGGDIPSNTLTWTDTQVENGRRYHYRVYAVANTVDGPFSNEVSAVPTLPGVFINSGAEQDSSDEGRGVLWKADYWNAAWAFGTSWPDTYQTLSISGAENPSLYLTIRRSDYDREDGSEPGIFYYEVSAPAGANAQHLVRLHFMEGTRVSEGAQTDSRARRFHVDINGQRVLTNFDIAAEAGGKYKVLVREFGTLVGADGKVRVTFTAADPAYPTDASVCAVEVIAGDSGTGGQTTLECGSAPVNGALTDEDETMSIPGVAGTFYVDRYSFAVTNGKRILLTATRTQGTFTPYLYLLAPEGYILKTSTGSGATATLDHTVTQDGIYTVVMTSAPSQPEVVGGYRLELVCENNAINPPNRPTGLEASPVMHPREVRVGDIELRWQDNSDNETGFEVWRRRTGEANPVRVGVLPASANTSVIWRQPNPEPATENVYIYTVRAVRNGLSSPSSNEASVATLVVPPVVTVITPLPGQQVTPVAGAITVEIAASASSGRDVAANGFVLRNNGEPVSGVTVTRHPSRRNRYQLVWNTPPTGDLRLSLTVTDTGGISATTPVQALTVGAVTVVAPVVRQVGQFTNGQRIIEIVPGTVGARVYYTIDYATVPNDGGDPTPEGANRANTHLYTGPFVLYRSGSVRARAFRFDTTAGQLLASGSADAAFDFQVTPITEVTPAYGVLNRQPDAYYNPFPSALPRQVAGVSGIEMFTGTARIWGSIAGEQVGSWQLAYRSLESDSRSATADSEQGWIVIRSGAGSSGTQALGDFDTTLLANGQYELRLRVFHLNYDPATPTKNYADTYRSVMVTGEQKNGPFTLSLTDLTLSAPGFPVQISRSYSSIDKSWGDFGVGWRLGVNNVRVQISGSAQDATAPAGRSRRVGDGWSEYRISGNGSTYYMVQEEPHYLSFTLPNGAVYGFRPVITPEASSYYSYGDLTEQAEYGGGSAPVLTFQPIPGTLADQERPATPNAPGVRLYPIVGGQSPTLSIPVGVVVGGGEELTGPGTTRQRAQLYEFGEDDMGGYMGGLLDIKEWLLEARDRTRYYIHVDLGVTRIVDPNGNQVDYAYDAQYRVRSITTSRNTPGGLVQTRRLDITRNAQGLIEQITDPAGSVITYQQDAQGNLIGYKDRTTDKATGVASTHAYRYDD